MSMNVEAFLEYARGVIKLRAENNIITLTAGEVKHYMLRHDITPVNSAINIGDPLLKAWVESDDPELHYAAFVRICTAKKYIINSTIKIHTQALPEYIHDTLRFVYQEDL